MLRELGEEQGVTGFIYRDCLVELLLLVETQAKQLHLHGEHVVGHSLGKTDAGISLLFGLLQDVEDDATTEADDGGTATIHIHHTVGIRQGELSLRFEPLAELLAHTGQLHHAVTTLQQTYRLEDVGLLLLGVAVVLAEGCEGCIWHLGEHHAGRRTILDVVIGEELLEDVLGAAAGEVELGVGYAAGGCDVVLAHLALVERLTEVVAEYLPHALHRTELLAEHVHGVAVGTELTSHQSRL